MNTNRLWETFHALTAIDSPSYKERQFCDAMKTRLAALDVEYYEDEVGQQIGGNSGNLYGYIPGSAGTDSPPVLFSAHMDTVEPSGGKNAVLQDNGNIVSKGDTILGADDVAGIAIILEAVTRIKEQGLPHRPIELLFPVAEEKYVLGSELAEYDRLHAKEAYTLDLTGEIGEAANAAPTVLSFTITIKGKAAHAGFAPSEGINAILIASKAVAQLPQGEPKQGLTFNIGTISGGEADNIVSEFCTISGEIRSLSHDKVLKYWEHVTSLFEKEAENAGASVEISHEIQITAYEIPLTAPVVRRFQEACADLDIPCNIHSTLGGSDNNNFTLHGISGLVMACSMHDVHSTREWSRLEELESCTQLVMKLMAPDDII